MLGDRTGCQLEHDELATQLAQCERAFFKEGPDESGQYAGPVKLAGAGISASTRKARGGKQKIALKLIGRLGLTPGGSVAGSS